MTEKIFTNLSGYWTGVYDLPDPSYDPVPFNAVLTEVDGGMTGETVEPNTFSSEPSYELFASLAGRREGGLVSFIKTYEPAPMAGHEVRYEGVVNPELTRIEGEWTTVETGGGWSGPFVMSRSHFGDEAARARAVAEETIDAAEARSERD